MSQNINCISALPFNQITDLELTSDLNKEKINTNTNLQVKISEVSDTDVLNNYNMDGNNDEKFDHTFFSDIDPNISPIQMKACISAKMNLTKKNSNNVICCSESWQKDSTRDRYTSK